MSNKRIHIIEDDRVLQNLLSLSLSKRGFDVTLSPNSYQIFDLTENLPDIFLLDVVMPGLNGLETCKWLKAQIPQIPIIILSGTPGLKVLAENAQADDFLEKPFEISKLVDKINRSLKVASEKLRHLN